MNTALHLYPVAEIDRLVTPEEFTQLTLDSPALQVFTDFAEQQPLVIDADTNASAAEEMMRRTHVRLKLVTDKDNCFIGLLSSDDLFGGKAMQLMDKTTLRSDLSVADLMRSRRDMVALDYNELSRYTVRDVVHLLQAEGLQHCLVVEHEHHHIRGIISAGDVARQLHIPLPVQERATTFAGVFQALHH